MGERAISGVTASRLTSAMHTHTGRTRRRGLTVVVRADLERLVPPHHEPDLLRLAVLQHAHVSRTPLLPLGRLGNEAEELCSPVKRSRRDHLVSCRSSFPRLHLPRAQREWTYILKSTSSSSSCVLTTTASSNLWTGSKVPNHVEHISGPFERGSLPCR